MTSPTHLIVVEISIAPQSGGVDPEEWYAEHAEQARRIPGVVRVERYWSEDGEADGRRHLALYHVSDSPRVMAGRSEDAKNRGQLSSSPFPDRTMRSYRLYSVLAD